MVRWVTLLHINLHFVSSCLEQWKRSAVPVWWGLWPRKLQQRNLHPSGTLAAVAWKNKLSIWVSRKVLYRSNVLLLTKGCINSHIGKPKQRKNTFHFHTAAFTCPLLSLKAWKSSGRSVLHRSPSQSPTSELELHWLHPLLSIHLSLFWSHSPLLGSVEIITHHQFRINTSEKQIPSNKNSEISINTHTPLLETCELQSSHSGCPP